MNGKIKRLPYLEQFRHLQKYLILAGIKKKPKYIYGLLFGIAGAIDLGIILYLFYLIWAYETLFIFTIGLQIEFVQIVFDRKAGFDDFYKL